MLNDVDAELDRGIFGLEGMETGVGSNGLKRGVGSSGLTLGELAMAFV